MLWKFWKFYDIKRVRSLQQIWKERTDRPGWKGKLKIVAEKFGRYAYSEYWLTNTVDKTSREVRGFISFATGVACYYDSSCLLKVSQS